VKLIFYASSSAQDTDFAAKLTEVYPDGISINLQAAVLRARYRDSLERPALLEEGKIYKFEMAIGATSVLFRKGHRIRLQVTSSNFPEYGRNLNTGADNGTTSQTVKAQQSIYHDREHPSHIILPVIPPEKQ
jgi:putative CocE/NonD family hydrolase